MITVENLRDVLNELHYTRNKQKTVYEKKYGNFDYVIKVDFRNDGKISYKSNNGPRVHRETTSNFSKPENFVCLECFTRLLDLGYDPKNIHFEMPTPGIIVSTDGYIDLRVTDNNDKTFVLIECKNSDTFDDYWRRTEKGGDQLFRYFNTFRDADALCMYTSDFDGKIKRRQNIIPMKDNESVLGDDEKLLSYRKVHDSAGRDFFKVWVETYHNEKMENGIFDDDAEPYKIGGTKHDITKIHELDNESMQRKYNEFATIMRQHNVGSHENAFDKLVNLFLAKIVDETDNPDELQFFWRGIAYDDYYSLQDRLQRLYKEGMKRFLGEEVAYIDQQQVDDAFSLFKNDEDATRNKIKEYFRQLKFYTNNDFSFLDVHNKELFYQNAEILKKMVEMLQNIKLRTDEQNQFLGDLFEGFLDDGVKQSEGQYFTPLPIVRFIISALPVESKIEKQGDVPKVIDYACGAGHFIAEYASYIKKKCKSINLEDHYKNIYGIEKEYRLSKVAKVSCFMYGFDDIQIVFGDALTPKDRIKEGSYSVLVSNPPYSVKGFMEVLGEAKENYELSKYVSDEAKNNSIECFFVERAKQLLDEGGVAAIVLPISVLTTKDNLYTACREIVLKYFDIIAISEFASGTFYKTPTNTVILFLRKKQAAPDLADHFLNRVNSWFDGDNSKDLLFDDLHYIDNYCDHCGIDVYEYKDWLNGAGMPKAEIFAKYIIDAKKTSAYKRLTERKINRRFSEEDKTKCIEKFLNDYVKTIEKDKLYYYMLVTSISHPVVISKSPSKTTDLKKFLGYEWSGEKGKEGIKYLHHKSSDKDNTIIINRGINGIQTPLFDPQYQTDNTKICNLIQKNYENDEIHIPDDLKEYVSVYNLEELIDFSKTTFNKVIRTSAPHKLEIKSKYTVDRIGKACSIINPPKSEISNLSKNTKCSFIDMDSVSVDGRIIKMDERRLKDVTGGYTYFKDNDVIIAKITPCMENGKCALVRGLVNGIGFGSSEFHVFRAAPNLLPEYLFLYLNRDIIRQHAQKNMTGASGHRRVPIDFYEDLSIPIPPISVQKRLVEKCKLLTDEYFNAKDTIKNISENMESIFNLQHGEENQLGVVASYVTDRVDYADIKFETYISTDNMLQNCGGVVVCENPPVMEKVVKYKKGDILVSNIRPYLKKIWYAERDGGCSPDVLVIRVNDPTKIHSKFLYYLLRQQSFFDWMMLNASGMKMPRGDKDTIMQYPVTIPKMVEQKRVLRQVEEEERNLLEAMDVIRTFKERRDAIIIDALVLEEKTL